ncbi:AraC family transcriptional regulator [Vibrio mediterranei]|uniref:helix-turn-helix domain-containing protein n=1 Tax=Vibrio mediterranei TaxID=689 RepID=UPI001EFD6255|nr:AraC family transcriptional regulator [Vibrio mediterranei]MCG9627558.1 AraC family transcriptional regulator [Vibrio mediterranei]
MTYWIGKSTLFLPKGIRTFLAERLSLVDVEVDISVLTEPREFVFFFYCDSEMDESTLLMSLKICRNLSKSLVLFHDGNLPDAYLESDLVYAHIDLGSEHALKKTSIVIQSLEKETGISLVNSITNTSPQNTSNNIGDRVSKESNAIHNAIDFIEANFTDNLKEVDVAEHCHLSTQHFSRTFHKVVGSSFRDYLAEKRLVHAKSLLLENPQVQISAIAYQCGYKDVSYFSRVFKKKTGMSPGTFRNFRGELKIN